MPGDDLDPFGDRRDFTEPPTPEETARSHAAWRSYLEGRDPGESLAEVRRAVLGEPNA